MTPIDIIMTSAASLRRTRLIVYTPRRRHEAALSSFFGLSHFFSFIFFYVCATIVCITTPLQSSRADKTVNLLQSCQFISLCSRTISGRQFGLKNRVEKNKQKTLVYYSSDNGIISSRFWCCILHKNKKVSQIY